MTYNCIPAAARRLAILILALALALTGCSGARPEGTEPTPGTFKTTTAAGAVAVIDVDTTGSVGNNTDLLAAAQNKATELVGRMPVGGRVVITAFNSNVGATCTDIDLPLKPQKNPDLEKKARQTLQAELPARFKALLDCSMKNDRHATELFGGLADTLRAYPDAEIVEVYTDGCDNVNVDLCNSSKLHDPSFPEEVLNELPAALIPQLSPSVAITYHGVGRGTQLDAAAIQGLRDVLSAWTTKTGATSTFVDY